jgi:hypothetical protein
MFCVYLVLYNADQTEGRGPMIPDVAFSKREDAEAYIDKKPGIMGYFPPEGRTAYRKRHGHYEGGWEIQTIQVADSLAGAQLIKIENIRAKAIKKLTEEERAVLGL